MAYGVTWCDATVWPWRYMTSWRHMTSDNAFVCVSQSITNKRTFGQKDSTMPDRGRYVNAQAFSYLNIHRWHGKWWQPLLWVGGGIHSHTFMSFHLSIMYKSFQRKRPLPFRLTSKSLALCTESKNKITVLEYWNNLLDKSCHIHSQTLIFNYYMWPITIIQACVEAEIYKSYTIHYALKISKNIGKRHEYLTILYCRLLTYDCDFFRLHDSMFHNILVYPDHFGICITSNSHPKADFFRFM